MPAKSAGKKRGIKEVVSAADEVGDVGANKRVKNAAHFYPCMRCDKGLLKLRHHLCPCDLEKVKAKNVVRVSYGDKGPLQGAPKRREAAAASSDEQ